MACVVHLLRCASPTAPPCFRYAEYTEPALWRSVADLYTRESARLAGLPKEGPLAVCVDAGCTAVPKLLKVDPHPAATLPGGWASALTLTWSKRYDTHMLLLHSSW